MREQIELLKDHAQLQANRSKGCQSIAIVVARAERVLADADLAGLKWFQAIQAAQERALAAAGWTDDRGNITLGDGQRNAAKNSSEPWFF